MKKLFKTVLPIFLALVLFVSGTLAVSAAGNESQVTPRWNVANNYNCAFSITGTNNATINVTYSSSSSNFQKANITVKLEKNFLLLFWTTVDIGYTNNEWTATSTNANGYFYNTFTVNGKGKYRAHITLEIIGKNGQKDVIEETLEYNYN